MHLPRANSSGPAFTEEEWREASKLPDPLQFRTEWRFESGVLLRSGRRSSLWCGEERCTCVRFWARETQGSRR
jgi:hypothetical protein